MNQFLPLQMPCRSARLIIRPVGFKQDAWIGFDVEIPPPCGNLAGTHSRNAPVGESKPALSRVIRVARRKAMQRFEILCERFRRSFAK